MTAKIIQPLRRLGALIVQMRIGPLLAFTVACLVIGEQFPFSDFPMYSSFQRDTYYVYLADERGQPLPTLATLGMTTPMLKKHYDVEVQREVRRLRTRRRLMSAEQKAPAGERILRGLKPTIERHNPNAAAGRTLRLYEVNIYGLGGVLSRRTDLIAEL